MNQPEFCHPDLQRGLGFPLPGRPKTLSCADLDEIVRVARDTRPPSPLLGNVYIHGLFSLETRELPYPWTREDHMCRRTGRSSYFRWQFS